jgi:hypothetical protein
MLLCSSLIIITVVFTDGISRVLNSVAFSLQIIIALFWYLEASNK